MAILQTAEEKRRWQVIYDMLDDLLKHPVKLSAVTDTVYKMVWDSIA